jgi:hypothetical protein
VDLVIALPPYLLRDFVSQRDYGRLVIFRLRSPPMIVVVVVDETCNRSLVRGGSGVSVRYILSVGFFQVCRKPLGKSSKVS